MTSRNISSNLFEGCVSDSHIKHTHTSYSISLNIFSREIFMILSNKYINIYCTIFLRMFSHYTWTVSLISAYLHNAEQCAWLTEWLDSINKAQSYVVELCNLFSWLSVLALMSRIRTSQKALAKSKNHIENLSYSWEFMT